MGSGFTVSLDTTVNVDLKIQGFLESNPTEPWDGNHWGFSEVRDVVLHVEADPDITSIMIAGDFNGSPIVRPLTSAESASLPNLAISVSLSGDYGLKSITFTVYDDIGNYASDTKDISYVESIWPKYEDFDIFCYRQDVMYQLLINPYITIDPARVLSGDVYITPGAEQDFVVSDSSGSENEIVFDIGVPSQWTLDMRWGITADTLPDPLSVSLSTPPYNYIFVGVYGDTECFGLLLTSTEYGVVAAPVDPTDPTKLVVPTRQPLANPSPPDYLPDPGEYATARLIFDGVANECEIYLTRPPGEELLHRFTSGVATRPAAIPPNRVVIKVLGGPPGGTSEFHIDSLCLGNGLIYPNRAPVALAEDRVISVGNLVTLDASPSYDPDEDSPLYYRWVVDQVPENSRIKTSALSSSDITGAAQWNSGNTTCSFTPDVLGIYRIELTVMDPEGLQSDPYYVLIYAVTATVATSCIPDASFIWRYLGDFWDFVDGKDKIETVWSGMFQLVASDLLNAYQVDYNKSLNDIQADFQRKWYAFDAIVDLSGSVIVRNLGHGSSGYSGGLQFISESSGLGMSGVSGQTENDGDYDEVTRKFSILDPLFPDLIQDGVRGISSGRTPHILAVSKTGSTKRYIIDEVYTDYVLIENEELPDRYNPSQDGYAEWQILRQSPNMFNTPSPNPSGAFVSGGVEQGDLIVIEGESYIIKKVVDENTVLIDASFKPLPSTYSGAEWRIPPQVKLNPMLVPNEVVAGDRAIFEHKETKEVREHSILGAGNNRIGLVFNNYDGFPTWITDGNWRFVGVRRRHRIPIDPSIRVIHSLQFILNNPTDSDYYYEGADYFTSTGKLDFVTLTGFAGSTEPLTPPDPNGYTNIFRDDAAKFNNPIVRPGAIINIEGTDFTIKKVLTPYILEVEETAIPDSYGGTGVRPQANWEIFPAEPERRWWAEYVRCTNDDAIEANFGRLVGFISKHRALLPSDFNYLAGVRGLAYAFIYGPTPNNIRSGTQIMLGLPFATSKSEIHTIDVGQAAATSDDRARVVLRDLENPGNYSFHYVPARAGEALMDFHPDTVSYNPVTGEIEGTPLAVGDVVDRFQPLSRGVEVKDYINSPKWFLPWTRSGRLHEAQKLSSFTVRIDPQVLSFVTGNVADVLPFIVEFIRNIRPVSRGFEYINPYTGERGSFIVLTLEQVDDISSDLVESVSLEAKLNINIFTWTNDKYFVPVHGGKRQFGPDSVMLSYGLDPDLLEVITYSRTGFTNPLPVPTGSTYKLEDSIGAFSEVQVGDLLFHYGNTGWVKEIDPVDAAYVIVAEDNTDPNPANWPELEMFNDDLVDTAWSVFRIPSGVPLPSGAENSRWWSGTTYGRRFDLAPCDVVRLVSYNPVPMLLGASGTATGNDSVLEDLTVDFVAAGVESGDRLIIGSGSYTVASVSSPTELIVEEQIGQVGSASLIWHILEKDNSDPTYPSSVVSETPCPLA